MLAIGADHFTVVTVPAQAAQLELFERLPPEYVSPDTGTLDPGEPVSAEQVSLVLEAYYKDTAIDFDSIRIRNLKLGRLGYLVWCSNVTFLGCLNRELRAGTWVDFEVNGKNRQGGMTGFQSRTFVIRRRPIPGATQAPIPRPAAQDGAASSPPKSDM